MSADTLAAALAAARADLSVSEAARRLGVARQLLYHYEAGTKAPTADRLAQIAATFRGELAVFPDGRWAWRPTEKTAGKNLGGKPKKMSTGG